MGSPADAGATRKLSRPCAQRHAVKRTPEARLFAVNTTYGRELFGCAGARGKPVSLGYLPMPPIDEAPDYLDFSLAGHFAATSYGLLDNKALQGGARVTIYNLKTRKRLLNRPVPGPVAAANPVLLTGKGQAAWDEIPDFYTTIRAPDGKSSFESRVVVFDHGAVSVVGSGLEIDASSVRLRGSTLLWVQAGVEHAYQL